MSSTKKYFDIFFFCILIFILNYFFFNEHKNYAESSLEINQINLIIKQKDWDHLIDYKNKILKDGYGYMLNNEKKWFKAKVQINNSKIYNAEIRLKGDQVEDHLIGDKLFSLRIKGDYFKELNLKRFSLHKTLSRGDMGEKLLLDELRNNEIISPKYELIKFSVNNKYQGNMALEGAIDESVIKNSGYQISSIFSLDESILFEERRIDRKFHNILEERYTNYDLMINLPIIDIIKPSNTKIKSLSKIGFYKLNKFYKDEYLKLDQIFDYKKFAIWSSILWIWNSEHGTIDHNLKLYFNPITLKFEPIAFDNHIQLEINQKNQSYILNKLIEDEEFIKELKLFLNIYEQRIYSKDFIENLKTKITKIENKSEKDLFNFNFNQLYEKIKINLMKLKENHLILAKQNFDFKFKSNPGKNFKKSLYPVKIYMSENENITQIEVYNFINSRVELNITSKQNKFIKKIPYNFFLKNNKFDYYSIELKDIDLSDAKFIIEYPDLNIEKKVKPNLISTINNLREFDFKNKINEYFIVDKGNLIPKNKILFIKNNLNIPSFYNLKIEKDLHLIVENSLLIIDANINSNDNLKITFKGNSFSGISLLNNDVKLNNLIIEDQRNLISSEISVLNKTFDTYNSNISINKAIVINSQAEDAINFYKSNVVINSLSIQDSKNDALDCDNSNISIKRLFITNSGNDALDFDSCFINFDYTDIQKSKDKAISIGGSTKAEFNYIRLDRNNIDIANKDNSNTIIKKLKILPNDKTKILSYNKSTYFNKNALLEIQDFENSNQLNVLSINSNIIKIKDNIFFNRDLSLDEAILFDKLIND